MPTHLRNIDFVKALRLKQVGIALASLWLIVLIATVASTIYREIDGPTVRSTVAENLNLAAINSTLNMDLDSARKANEVANGMIDQLNADSMVSQSDLANFKRRLYSYLSSAPPAQIGPNPAAHDVLLLP